LFRRVTAEFCRFYLQAPAVPADPTQGDSPMNQTIDSSVNQRFTSRITFLLSVLGIAVGTGNIWRFPRIAAQCSGENGAGAFLIAWVIFLFAWSIPLIIAEYALGRHYRSGVITAVSKAAGKALSWMGTFIAFVSTAITFFYSVIVGWCIYYFFRMLLNPLPASPDASMAVWNSYQSSPWPLAFHAAAMLVGTLAIWKGVKSIEKVNKVLIPTLLCIVLISVIRALTLPGALEGVKYLFTPQWDQLARPRIWLEALTQNAWDTGAGWGLFLTYAAYMKKEHGLVKNAFFTGIGNNTISILSGIMIFGTVFAVLTTGMNMTRPEILEVMKTSGPASTGLTFIWMPQLFARMMLGHPIAVLFFLGLTFAGFSSLIAMLELPTRVVVDAGVKRPYAIAIVVGVSYVLGIPSAMNLNLLSNQDFVWGLGLILSGAFIAVTLIRAGISRMRTQVILADENDMHIGKWWEIEVSRVVPVMAGILLLWWLSLCVLVYAPDTWWNPLKGYSIATVLCQWLVVLVIFIAANRWISSHMVKE